MVGGTVGVGYHRKAKAPAVSYAWGGPKYFESIPGGATAYWGGGAGAGAAGVGGPQSPCEACGGGASKAGTVCACRTKMVEVSTQCSALIPQGHVYRSLETAAGRCSGVGVGCYLQLRGCLQRVGSGPRCHSLRLLEI